MTFRVDDKIVCLKNGLNICDETDISAANIDQIDGKVFVANGEIGRVIAIEEKFVTAMFDAPKRVIKIILAAGMRPTKQRTPTTPGQRE